jgi:hypothetical protein
MEAVLDSHEKLKQCYNQFSLEEVRTMSAKDMRGLCLKERESFAENFNKMDMKNIIDERINILKQQRENKYNLRYGELKNFYKL